MTGGGLLPGMVALLGGDPGIGKSTLLMQTADSLAGQGAVLYVSGEESAAQLKLRAERLGVKNDLLLLCDTSLENALEQARRPAERLPDRRFHPDHVHRRVGQRARQRHAGARLHRGAHALCQGDGRGRADRGAR